MDENKSSNQSPLAGIALFTAVMVVAIVIGASWSETVQAEPKIESPKDFLIKISDNVMTDLNELGSNVQNNKLDRVYGIIGKHILKHLDCITMTKLALGGNWAQVNKQKRNKYVNEFIKLLMSTYGKALNEYSDQKINFLSEKLTNTKYARIASVKAEIDRPDGPSIPMTYRLRVKNNTWKVYDIKIDGISLVTSFRGTFTQVVRQSGIEELLIYMRDKNSKLHTIKMLDAKNHPDICTR